MYADIFGTLPIAEALVGKGVGLGTVLAFMMGVTALSLPSIILLKTLLNLSFWQYLLLLLPLGSLSLDILLTSLDAFNVKR